MEKGISRRAVVQEPKPGFATDLDAGNTWFVDPCELAAPRTWENAGPGNCLGNLCRGPRALQPTQQ